jgi:hypothetical protein
LTVSVWSYPARIISPWLRSLVQAPEGRTTLFARANGLFSVAAGGLHGPAMLLEVQDRK